MKMSIGEAIEDIIGPLNIIENAIGFINGRLVGDFGY